MRKFMVAILAMAVFSLSSCYTHVHRIGQGAKTEQKISKKQWYILWGLVPLNDVDTHALAGDAEDYEIKTQHSFVDLLIGIFTGIVTIHPKTVTVKK